MATGFTLPPRAVVTLSAALLSATACATQSPCPDMPAAGPNVTYAPLNGKACTTIAEQKQGDCLKISIQGDGKKLIVESGMAREGYFDTPGHLTNSFEVNAKCVSVPYGCTGFHNWSRENDISFTSLGVFSGASGTNQMALLEGFRNVCVRDFAGREIKNETVENFRSRRDWCNRISPLDAQL